MTLALAVIVFLLFLEWFGIWWILECVLFVLGWLLQIVLRLLYDSGWRFGGILRESDDPSLDPASIFSKHNPARLFLKDR